MDFLPDFFHVGDNITGNLSAIGIIENNWEEKVTQLVQELRGYGLCVPAYMVTEKLEEYDIPYELLPQYLKDLIDTLNVY